MSLVKITLDAISQIANVLESDDLNPRVERKVLSLGYPDILVSKEDIASLFGESFLHSLRFREDSASILRWHKIQDKIQQIPDSYHFFKLLGYHLDVIDIEIARGDEIILNLNDPIQNSLKEVYHLVIDAGTLEHCFNIAQAQKNIAELVVEGGYILQSNPLNWFNHGFYNINPTFYYDFYEQNGFKIILQKGLINSVLNPQTFDVPAYDRFESAPVDSINLLVIQRESVQEILWPIQAKYRENPQLKS